jgi:hypothetical protein
VMLREECHVPLPVFPLPVSRYFVIATGLTVTCRL